MQQTQEMFAALNENGFPCRMTMVGGPVPFDMISDLLRGMRGSMLDMYRRPDTLLAAIEKISDQNTQSDRGRAETRRVHDHLHGPASRLRRLHVAGSV